jgi:hypothetical protein
MTTCHRHGVRTRWIDGIFVPALDAELGWNIFTSRARKGFGFRRLFDRTQTENHTKRIMSIGARLLAALGTVMLLVAPARSDAPIGILLAAGDIAKCGSEKRHLKDDKVADLLVAQVKDADSKNIPVHVIALGDLAYDKGSEDNFKCFDASWGKLFKLQLQNNDAARVMLPVPGNHEYQQGEAEPYYKYFEKMKSPWVFQQEKDQKRQRDSNKGYYVLKFPDPQRGPWQLFGLNSELGFEATKAQASWVQQQLSANDPQLQPAKPPCVMAFWHKPVFSSGTHGHGDCGKTPGRPCEKTDAPLCKPDETAESCGSLKKMKAIYGLLRDSGASVVLAGHDHHFEQFKRLDANAKLDAQGIRSFIVGTGGGGLYQKERTHRWGDDVRDVYSHTSDGVLRIELFPDHYTWSFVPAAGDPPISLVVKGQPTDRDTCVARH